MKTFVAVFIGTPEATERSGWNALPEAQRNERAKAGIAAWHQWVETHKASIVDGGAPLGKTKRISRAGVEDTKNALTGYTIVRAESHDAAAKLFENHPHFAIFPGECIEIMESLPIPAM